MGAKETRNITLESCETGHAALRSTTEVQVLDSPTSKFYQVVSSESTCREKRQLCRCSQS